VKRFEFRPANEADPDHPLAAIEGAPVPGGVLRVELGPRIIGSRHFRLHVDGGGSRNRFVQALFANGPYPGMNWAEVFDLELPPGIDPALGWEVALEPFLRPLGALIPAGGHLMIEYEKSMWSTTQLALLEGVPPLVTPMGRLLGRLDFGASIKDWYFPEGGQEGGRKLQGNRALSRAHDSDSRRARAAEIREWLAGPLSAAGESFREDALRTLAEIEARP
jgi:hypothetical protein